MYRVGKSSAGLGLFATEKIKKGETITEYIGELISVDEADRRGGKYLFEVNSKKTIDGSMRQNTARYINHGCKPNAEAEIRNRNRVFILAKKTINPGEEIVYHYGKEYFNEYIKPKGCKCSHCNEK